MTALSALLLALGLSVVLVVAVDIVIVESHELRQARKEARGKRPGLPGKEHAEAGYGLLTRKGR